MTITEIKNEIERLDHAMFVEQMADFMDWNAYRDIKRRKEKLELELTKMMTE